MNYTNINQSKNLLELGLSPNSADMFYKQKISERTDMPYYDIIVGHSFAAEQNLFSFRDGFEIPCWSLGALLELMPKNKDYSMCWDLSFGSYDNNDDFISKYHCDFIDSSEDLDNSIIKSFNEDTLIEVIYNMVVWLLENNYIKKGE